MVKTSQKFGFPDHWKTEQNGSHAFFGPLKSRTSKRLVFQCLIFKPTLFSYLANFLTR